MILSRYTVGNLKVKIDRSRKVALTYSVAVSVLALVLHIVGQRLGWGETNRELPIMYQITIFFGNLLVSFVISLVALTSFPMRNREPDNYRLMRVLGGYIACAIGISNAYVIVSSAADPRVRGGLGIIGSFLLASWYIATSLTFGAMQGLSKKRR